MYDNGFDRNNTCRLLQLVYRECQIPKNAQKTNLSDKNRVRPLLRTHINVSLIDCFVIECNSISYIIFDPLKPTYYSMGLLIRGKTLVTQDEHQRYMYKECFYCTPFILLFTVHTIVSVCQSKTIHHSDAT